MKKYVLASVFALALVGMVAGWSISGGKPYHVTLNGASEVPGPGDFDGSGTFHLTVNPGQGEICYTLTWEGIDEPTAAHIHRAPIGEAGAVVVPLTVSATGSSSDCVSIDRELANELIKDPGAFYVNVHNVAYPSGAIRAQLDGADDQNGDKHPNNGQNPDNDE